MQRGPRQTHEQSRGMKVCPKGQLHVTLPQADASLGPLNGHGEAKEGSGCGSAGMRENVRVIGQFKSRVPYPGLWK